ncbi:MAG: nitroreductase/quinone reductase family protein [Actinobacteria bacterium]|nr:nitroreductase/quinone reductase family protein [Actinomycetota bacterium]
MTAWQSRNTRALGRVQRRVDIAVKNALDRGGVIDITTLGARSGTQRRIEINFHHLDGSYYITGMPGRKRDWLANMKANPKFTIHLKHGLTADVAAEAEEVTNEDQRAKVLYRILTESWDNEPAKAEHILPRWVNGAPLVEFSVV